MQKRWLICAVAVIVLFVTLAVAWLRSSMLRVERTIIAELPKHINHLIKTDLDGDGEIELVATYHVIGSDWMHHLGEFEDPRIWLIHSPLTNPQVLQLPYVFRLDFPSNLPPLRELLVEDGEWCYLNKLRYWQPRGLGWLRMRSRQIHFEPLAEGIFGLDVLSHKNSVTLLLSELLAAPKNPRLKINRPYRRFAFRLQSDGTWRPIDPPKVHLPTSFGYPHEFGDFDGDGFKDVVYRNDILQVACPPLTVKWGDGSPPTSLPFAHEFHATDVDNDGRWEIVTLRKDTSIPNQWKLSVWQFHLNKRCFATTAQLVINAPNQSLHSSVPNPAIKAMSSQPTSIEPIFQVADLNGDGCKDFVLVWAVVGDRGSGVIDFTGVQVIWWQGKKLQVCSFAPCEVAFPTPPEFWGIFNEHRLAIITAYQLRRRFAFRLLSLRPLHVQFWKIEGDWRSAIFQIPEGENALDLRRWKKLAELPGRPLWLTGDWNNDGKLELLLERRFVHEPIRFPFFQPSRSVPISVLYLACVDRYKVRWAKLVPPLPASFDYALPVQVGNDVALFVLWRAKDEVFLERIRW